MGRGGMRGTWAGHYRRRAGAVERDVDETFMKNRA
jgi:hypothetical protein